MEFEESIVNVPFRVKFVDNQNLADLRSHEGPVQRTRSLQIRGAYESSKALIEPESDQEYQISTDGRRAKKSIKKRDSLIPPAKSNEVSEPLMTKQK